MRTPGGFPIVLTADPTLMADYRLLFDGVLVANQTTTTPAMIIRALMMPAARGEGIRAKVAPLGLRRIEAALLADGFGREAVAVVHPKHLREAIGPETRVVGVAAGEPAGLGMSTTTTVAIAGGTSFPAALFRKLMRAIRDALRRADARAAVVAGGPGAWQLAGAPERRRESGIDHVVVGYAEGNVAGLFRDVIAHRSLPEVIAGEPAGAADVPRIRGASTMGVVEISRGCGLGCSFCTIARTPMFHLPQDTILADVETNLAGGVRNLCVISEDVFRYGAEGVRARPEALIDLLERLRRIGGVGLIQTDHGNVFSVSQYSDRELAAVRTLMTGSTGQRYPWVNIGVETASGALLRANGCAAKMGGLGDDEWGPACADQLRRLCRAGFLPIASVVVGLPGEMEADVGRTIAWVRSVSNERVAVFPVLHAPIDPAASAPSVSRLQWQLIRMCYRLNFKWIPRMYWDSQRAAGVGAAQRCLMQALGRAQAALWRGLFALRARGRH